MNRIEQLASMEMSLRHKLREVYIHGVGRISHAEMQMSLDRERVTPGFHADLERLWSNEMELLGYDSTDAPTLRYSWVPDVNEWAFALGRRAGMDWKHIGG